MIRELAISMRLKHWYKNLILFICIVFSGNLLDVGMWLWLVLAFAIFCMLSGSQYMINDVLDADKDRNHPRKRNRPIASGSLPASAALVSAVVLLFAALWGAIMINVPFFVAGLSYFLLILVYSMFLKHMMLVDILTISVGFVIRAVAGCLVIGVLISPWLILCTFLLALFLALGKRRHELVLLGGKAARHRKSLKRYSTEMLDSMISIITASLLMSYSLYTFLADSVFLMLTIPFAIYGLFRYLFLVHRKNVGGETEMIFRDRGMLACMVLWVLLIVFVLYFLPQGINGSMFLP
jgi:4-hydroxybenzoate polyprenyltransferase